VKGGDGHFFAAAAGVRLVLVRMLVLVERGGMMLRRMARLK